MVAAFAGSILVGSRVSGVYRSSGCARIPRYLCWHATALIDRPVTAATVLSLAVPSTEISSSVQPSTAGGIPSCWRFCRTAMADLPNLRATSGSVAVPSAAISSLVQRLGAATKLAIPS